MKFAMGKTPEWKGKPKSSPLDDDADFQKLVSKVTSGAMKQNDEAGLYIHEIEDGKRLGAKNPARMVRDHLNRILRENELEGDYQVTCRRTIENHVWAVWITRIEVAGAGPRHRKTA